MLSARFESSWHCKLTIRQSFAPANEADAEVKDEFYNMLQGSILKTPWNYMLLVIGDLNAKVGTDREGREQAICTKGIEERNMNREKLLDLYLNIYAQV